MSLKPCCATGSLHTGTPTGRIEKVHGLDTYIAEAPNGPPKGVVVIIPDAFGIALPNNRILADCYAKEGNFKVYLPDFMDGQVVPIDVMQSLKFMSTTGLVNNLKKVSHVAYMIRHFVPFLFFCRYGVTAPRIYSWLKALKQNEAKDLNVGTAGFCWGAQFVTVLCHDLQDNRLQDGKRVTNCGFVAHPSALKYPDSIDPIVLPYSVAAPEHDPQMSPENAKLTEKILKEKTEKTRSEGIEHEFVLYEGAHHGFAVRADEEDKEEAEKGKQAEAQAVKWFSWWFTHSPPS